MRQCALLLLIVPLLLAACGGDDDSESTNSTTSSSETTSTTATTSTSTLPRTTTVGGEIDPVEGCDDATLDAVKAQVATKAWTRRTDATFAVHTDPERCVVVVSTGDLTADEEASLRALGGDSLVIENGTPRRL